MIDSNIVFFGLIVLLVIVFVVIELLGVHNQYVRARLYGSSDHEEHEEEEEGNGTHRDSGDKS